MLRQSSHLAGNARNRQRREALDIQPGSHPKCLRLPGDAGSCRLDRCFIFWQRACVQTDQRQIISLVQRAALHIDARADLADGPPDAFLASRLGATKVAPEQLG